MTPHEPLTSPPVDRTRTTGGTGLVIVDTLTHRNQGAVTARNHPDGGAEISIRLPAAPAPPTRERQFHFVEN